MLAAVSGAVIAVPSALASKRGMQTPIPFGVFLGGATLAVIFFGSTLAEWYLSLLAR